MTDFAPGGAGAARTPLVTPDYELLAAAEKALRTLGLHGVGGDLRTAYASDVLAAAGRWLAAQADERNDLTAGDIRRLCGVAPEGSAG